MNAIVSRNQMLKSKIRNMNAIVFPIIMTVIFSILFIWGENIFDQFNNYYIDFDKTTMEAYNNTVNKIDVESQEVQLNLKKTRDLISSYKLVFKIIGIILFIVIGYGVYLIGILFVIAYDIFTGRSFISEYEIDLTDKIINNCINQDADAEHIIENENNKDKFTNNKNINQKTSIISLNIILKMFLTFIIPLIIVHLMFKIKTNKYFLLAEWNAGDLLTYCMGFFTLLGTLYLGYITYLQNRQLNKVNLKLNEENISLAKSELNISRDDLRLNAYTILNITSFVCNNNDIRLFANVNNKFINSVIFDQFEIYIGNHPEVTLAKAEVLNAQMINQRAKDMDRYVLILKPSDICNELKKSLEKEEKLIVKYKLRIQNCFKIETIMSGEVCTKKITNEFTASFQVHDDFSIIEEINYDEKIFI